MCIIADRKLTEKYQAKMGRITCWKVIKKDNSVGIWGETVKLGREHTIGENYPTKYYNHGRGRYNCFATRVAARAYRAHRTERQFVDFVEDCKIIKVCVWPFDIIEVGSDSAYGFNDYIAIAAKVIGIASLKHQR